MSDTLRALFIAAVSLALALDDVPAQSTLGENRRQTTRAELEQFAKAKEELAASTREQKSREKLLADVVLIRQRLKNGDFAPGDRIFLQVYGDSVLSDTFTVRVDRRLRLPDIPDLSLEGVLDSELESHLTSLLAVYIKDVRVQATGLVRLSVMGSVGKPGFLTVTVDKALTDVIMEVGGPSGQADLNRAIVRRGSQTLLDGKGMQAALRQGKTVGDVSMRDGDEIFVPDRSQRVGAQTILGAVGAAASLIWTLSWALRL